MLKDSAPPAGHDDSSASSAFSLLIDFVQLWKSLNAGHASFH